MGRKLRVTINTRNGVTCQVSRFSWGRSRPHLCQVSHAPMGSARRTIGSRGGFRLSVRRRTILVSMRNLLMLCKRIRDHMYGFSTRSIEFREVQASSHGPRGDAKDFVINMRSRERT